MKKPAPIFGLMVLGSALVVGLVTQAAVVHASSNDEATEQQMPPSPTPSPTPTPVPTPTPSPTPSPTPTPSPKPPTPIYDAGR